MTYRCAISLGREATYGTAVATGREVAVMDEAFDWPDPDVDGEGFYSGAEGPLDTAICRPTTSGTGSLSLQPTSKGFGLLAEELMGAGASTLVSAGVYQQVFTFADVLPSVTVQKQVPQRDGTIVVQQHKGCVVTGFELGMDAKGILTLSLNYDVRDPSGTAAADALTKIIGTRFCFAGAASFTGTITAPTTTALGIGSVPLAGVRSAKVTVDHKLDTDNPFHFGAAGLKDKPLPTGELRSIEVELTRELIDASFETAYRAGTNIGLVLTFESEALAAGKATVQIVLPALRAKGPLPKVSKEAVAVTPYKLVAYKTAAFAQRMWLVLRTSDAALA